MTLLQIARFLLVILSRRSWPLVLPCPWILSWNSACRRSYPGFGTGHYATCVVMFFGGNLVKTSPSEAFRATLWLDDRRRGLSIGALPVYAVIFTCFRLFNQAAECSFFLLWTSWEVVPVSCKQINAPTAHSSSRRTGRTWNSALAPAFEFDSNSLLL